MDEDPPGSVGGAIVPRAGATVWRVGLRSWCLRKGCRLLCLLGPRSTNKHQVGLPLHVWVGTAAKLAQRESVCVKCERMRIQSSHTQVRGSMSEGGLCQCTKLRKTRVNHCCSTLPTFSISASSLQDLVFRNVDHSVVRQLTFPGLSLNGCFDHSFRSQTLTDSIFF